MRDVEDALWSKNLVVVENEAGFALPNGLTPVFGYFAEYCYDCYCSIERNSIKFLFFTFSFESVLFLMYFLFTFTVL